MALDEAALETLGLGTLWVRREASSGHSPVVEEPVTPEPAETPRPTAAPPTAGREATLLNAVRERPAASKGEQGGHVSAEPFGDEPAWDDFEPVPPAMPNLADADADAVAAGEARHADGVSLLDWDALEARVSACERCRLCEKRTNTVFGVGDRAADWMLIGEAPGENEDKQGEPFVGQAGKLLDSMLRALSLSRGDNVYIANVVKCRPPGNRNPEPDEVARCEPYLQRQVALLKPKLIVALGRVAAQNLLKTDVSISSLRGRVHRYEDVPVVVTYHPAYLLRSLPDKAKAWADLCLAHDTYRQVLAAEQAPR
ncbi:uracil-DNA glycosylase [Trinickia sp.]|uniref:uracil-DNA glycosylase n=1 Tax=Trinickia sp. TaxID=2571163 RepID=UPI003F7E7644